VSAPLEPERKSVVPVTRSVNSVVRNVFIARESLDPLRHPNRRGLEPVERHEQTE
jgi:hypothetical protein